MINKSHKIRKEELERERYSSFVVDLREKIAPVKSKTEVKIKKPIFSLAYQPKQVSFISSFKKTNFKFPKLSFSKLSFSRSFFPKLSAPALSFSRLSLPNLFKKRKKTWLKEINKQHKLFSARFKLNKKERLAIAENKVIWYRSIFSFTIILILIIIPIKLLSYFELFNISGLEAKIMDRSKGAINNLLAAAESVSDLDFQEADAKFSEAGDGFLKAQDDLSIISDSLLFLASWSGDPKIKLAAESKKFLAAGAVSSSLGKNLVLATDSLFNQSSEEANFLLALDNFSKYGQLAVEDAKQLNKIVASINPKNLPSEYQAKFLALANQAELLSSNLDNFVSSATKMKEILGLSKDKRYLLIFQNNSELRASGGFLGSYALVDLSGGKIKNLEVPGGGSYDTEGGMTVKVKAPEPLWPLNPLWHFWDANWWPDWKITSQNLMWFYEKSNGPTVDGVISLTPTVVERLLEITGPIDLTAEYGIIIDSQNFWETTQKIVEHKNLSKTNPNEIITFSDSKELIKSAIPLEQGLTENVDNKPKKIIGDLMAKILEVLPSKLNQDNLLKIISIFEDSMAEKQVMFYFKDPVLQAEVSKRNWSGEVKNINRDYLMVVNTNIAGQKTDRVIKETINHLSRVDASGKIINTVKITRAHSGVNHEALTGVRNVNWLRVYVPAGSRLISATGFVTPDFPKIEEPDSSWEDSQFLQNEKIAETDKESGLKIYFESGKTVFAGWTVVDPGRTIELTLEYELPFSFFEDNTARNGFFDRLNKLLNPATKDLWKYSLLVQKQPGAKPSDFYSRLYVSNEVEAFWKHPKDLNWNDGWEISDQITADKYFSVLLNRAN